ncbi:MAG TPA: RluA family pseudouridine synthase [Polyangia bacterium]|jgi:23S rRNA pseudouridine1911/1915/1917 synthase
MDAPARPGFDAPAPGVIVYRYTVEPNCHGLRLDLYLKHKIGRLSRAKIQRIIEGQLTLNGVVPSKAGVRVATGDEVVIAREPWPEPEVPREFGVLHDDAELLAIDKPAGLPIHPTARYYFNTLTALMRARFPGQPLQVAHRLDRETSGVMLVARGPEAGRKLKQAFERRRVHKRYLALVRGAPPDDGVIDLAMKLGGPLRVSMVVSADGLPAVTRYRVAARLTDAALVECFPETGRQHQIRVHLAAIGHPVLGDKVYPEPRRFAYFCDHGLTPDLLADLDGFARQALHAASITFPHPRDGAPMTIEAPLPEDMRAAVARLGGAA